MQFTRPFAADEARAAGPGAVGARGGPARDRAVTSHTDWHGRATAVAADRVCLLIAAGGWRAAGRCAHDLLSAAVAKTKRRIGGTAARAASEATAALMGYKSVRESGEGVRRSRAG